MVGFPTVAAIIANKFIPKTLDRYLARTGYRSQQTDEPADPNRPDNLWEPLPDGHRAHGRFDERSYRWSIQWWAARHPAWLAGAGFVVAAGGALLAAGRREAKSSRRSGSRLERPVAAALRTR
jgi:hypothetical protein